MRRTLGLLPLAVVALPLLAVSCFGGSGGSADGSTTSSSETRSPVITTSTTTTSTIPTAATPETTTSRPTGGPRIHTVNQGEVLGQIAEQYGVSVDAIVEANGLESPDLIYEDQELVIPPPDDN